jgi:hypothetical protein
MKHVTTEMTLRYASLAAPTIRVAYEEAMNKARNRLALTISPVGKPIVSGHRHVGDMLASRCVRESDRPPRHVLGIGLAVARRRVIQQHSVDLRPLLMLESALVECVGMTQGVCILVWAACRQGDGPLLR